jgi:hypothetical protein
MTTSRSIIGRALIGALAFIVGCRQAAPAPAPSPIAVMARSETRVFPRPTQAQLDSFSFDVPLPADTGVCVRRSVPVGVGRMISVYYPDQRQAEASQTVTLDSMGHIVRFSEQRGRMNLQGLRGATPAQFDSAIVATRRANRSSSLYLDFVLGQAMLGNEGGGRPEQHWMVPLSDVANNPRFDRPLARAYAIVSRCQDSERDHGYFEFQVQKPAAYVGGTSVSPHPAASGATVVQFVVDSTGAIRPSTLKVLRTENSQMVEDIRRAITQWRYLPAELGGRKVAQLVQTAVVR